MEWNDTGIVIAKGLFKEADLWLRILFREHGLATAFAFGGANRQVELLQAEGVGFIDETHVDMSRCRVPFLPMV